MHITDSLVEKFWSKVQKPSSKKQCFMWTGAKNGNGYGALSVDKKTQYSAHRFSYALHNGSIPPGALIRHTCDQPLCVNPLHLITGSFKENTGDAISRGRFKPWPMTKEKRPRGVTHGMARLTESHVTQIREEYSKGDISQSQLAEKYGVIQITISRIVRRKLWAHL